MNLRPFGLLAALITASSWGGMFPLFGMLLHHLDPFWLTSIRYVGAGLILCAILLAVEGREAFKLDRRWPLLAGLGSLAIAGFNLFVLCGIRLSTPEHGSILVALGPTFVTLITSVRTRTAPHSFSIVTILAAFAGVAMVATKGDVATVIRGGSLEGDAIMLAGVLSFSLYTAFAPTFKDWTWLRFTALSVGFGALTTTVVTALATAFGAAHVPVLRFDEELIFGMFYMIAIAAVAAFMLWNFAIRAIGAPNTALFFNAVPVVAFTIAILTGHKFSTIEYAGALLTIAALVVGNIASRAPAPVAEPVRSAA